MVMIYYPMPKSYEVVIEVLNQVFNFVFNLEAFLKIMGLGRFYFFSNWNK